MSAVSAGVVWAFTVYQPWATLIAEQCKPYEYRGHDRCRAYVGQRIAVHAAARRMQMVEIVALQKTLETGAEGTGIVNVERALKILGLAREDARLKPSDPRPRHLPLSAIVCTAMLGVPKRATEIHGDSDRVSHHVFGWPMLVVRRIEPPMPARGAQGFWRAPAGIAV